MAAPSKHRVRRAALAAAVAAALGAGTAAAVAALADGSKHPTPRTSLIVGPERLYERSVAPLIRDWGSVAVEGMRPGIADLASPGGLPRLTAATEAKAWAAAFRHDREQLLRIPVPSGYVRYQQLLLQSLDGYLRASAIVERAAHQADPAARHRTLERAAHVLTVADQVFEQARRVIA